MTPVASVCTRRPSHTLGGVEATCKVASQGNAGLKGSQIHKIFTIFLGGKHLTPAMGAAAALKLAQGGLASFNNTISAERRIYTHAKWYTSRWVKILSMVNFG